MNEYKKETEVASFVNLLGCFALIGDTGTLVGYAKGELPRSKVNLDSLSCSLEFFTNTQNGQSWL